jgi:hypothetical protein
VHALAADQSPLRPPVQLTPPLATDWYMRQDAYVPTRPQQVAVGPSAWGLLLQGRAQAHMCRVPAALWSEVSSETLVHYWQRCWQAACIHQGPQLQPTAHQAAAHRSQLTGRGTSSPVHQLYTVHLPLPSHHVPTGGLPSLHQPCQLTGYPPFPMLQISMSETRILKDWHTDAEHLYNTTMDLRRCIEELRDPNKRYPRKVCLPLCATTACSVTSHVTLDGHQRQHRLLQHMECLVVLVGMHG